MARRFSDLERRVAGAQGRLLAKMAEFPACVTAGDKPGAERCRLEATALLESFFDLSDQAVQEMLKRGY